MTSHQNLLQQLNGNNLIWILLLSLLVGSCNIFSKSRTTDTPQKETETNVEELPAKKSDTTAISKGDTIKTDDKEENRSIEKWAKKNVYNVAFILPFSIDASELYTLMNDENITSYQPLAAISLYEGALLALDSLKAMQINLEVHVFNAAKDSNNINSLIADGSLKNMDLIIGPIFNECLIPAAQYAKESETYLISPLSPSLSITTDNPFYIMANTSLNTQLKKSAEFINAKNESVNIIIIHQPENVNEIKLAKDFEVHMTETQKTNSWRTTTTITSISKINELLEPGKLNCIFLATQNELFVNQILRTASLITKNQDVFLMGLSSILNFESVSLDYLETLNFHYPSTFWIDPLAPRIKKFKEDYSERYHAAPDEYAYRGYDLTLYAGYLLFQNGPDISKGFSKAKPVSHLLSPLHFSPEKNGSENIQFYENQNVTILRYSNYRFEKAN